MAGRLIDVEEFELDRERDLLDNSEFREQSIQEMEEFSAPGTYVCHEALHTSYLMHTIILSSLCEHISIVCNKSWYIKSRQIASLLYELYSEIAIAHNEEDEIDV